MKHDMSIQIQIPNCVPQAIAPIDLKRQLGNSIVKKAWSETCQV